MTFSNDARFLAPVVQMMMGSREAVVDYMTPLGLHHQMARGHHYGQGRGSPAAAAPTGPRCTTTAPRSVGIGFDRSASGSNAVAQYSPEVAKIFGSIDKVPEKYLLWFHHVPWDHRMASGRTLWDELVVDYTRGVETVSNMRKTWASVAPYVDAERHAEVAAFLAIQEKEARWWRDACIAYFQSFSKRPLPQGYAPPAKTLQEYEAMRVALRAGASARQSTGARMKTRAPHCSRSPPCAARWRRRNAASASTDAARRAHRGTGSAATARSAEDLGAAPRRESARSELAECAELR